MTAIKGPALDLDRALPRGRAWEHEADYLGCAQLSTCCPAAVLTAAVLTSTVLTSTSRPGGASHGR